MPFKRWINKINLQIVLETDGSLIEEFEVMCIISSRADLIFMLLPEEATWTSPDSASSTSGQSSGGGKIHIQCWRISFF